MSYSHKPFELVSVLDDAIDHQQSDLKKYIQTRDMSHLKFKEGQKPTIFVCKHITTRLYNKVVLAATSDAEKYIRAFQLGIVEIRNFVRDDGSIMEKYLPVEKEMVTPSMAIPASMSDEQLDDFSPAIVQEIGAVLNDMAFLGKASVGGWQLQRSLLTPLATKIARAAEETLSEPEEKSS